DSLRDFIISLDKSKADKLRYKVEENVVKIFITPYRTSITEKDLEFTQGEINVDVVLALGVTQQEDLDQAITAHGRILHDATVIAVTHGEAQSTVGNINWQEPAASGLSEMLVSISEALQAGLIDAQIATAFLTGIVAETDRFSNPKTSPKVMTMSAQLMAAGANQQLIANELQKTVSVPLQQAEAEGVQDQKQPEASAEAPTDDGALAINHEEEQPAEVNQVQSDAPIQEQVPTPEAAEPALVPPSVAGRSILPEISTEAAEDIPTAAGTEQIAIDDDGNFIKQQRPMNPKHNKVISPPKSPDDSKNTKKSASALVESPTTAAPIVSADTIQALEESINQESVASTTKPVENIDSARSAVDSAIGQAGFDPNRPQPRVDLNAQPFEPELPQETPQAGNLPQIDSSLILPEVQPNVAINADSQAPPPLPPPLPM
ncbi:MAG: hypothetical protein M3Q36_03090, partial [bacterium]|nr:hypothetical protein [bacterium]